MDNKFTKEKYHNSDYFENIDRKEKAYLLGYLIADGSIEDSPRKDRPSRMVRLRFGCATEDDELIKFVQKEIAPNNKLRYYQPKGSNRKQITILQICDKRLTNTLINKYGVLPRKTNDSFFTFPDISKKFERDFIRGYIDGDGSFGKHHFSMILNSYEFAVQIKDKFVE